MQVNAWWNLTDFQPRSWLRECQLAVKKHLLHWLRRRMPGGHFALADLPELRRILIIRPNFRIGNVLISARIIPALHRKYPAAQIDILTGAPTMPLLQHMDLTHIEGLSRAHGYRWISLGRLLLKLRRTRYDAVVDPGSGSFSSAILAWITSAPYRIGMDIGNEDALLNVRLPCGERRRPYDRIQALAAHFDPATPARPYYRVHPNEASEAHAWLQQGLSREDPATPFIALFVGGRRNKRLPATYWASYVTHLSGGGVPILLFSGPEERSLVSKLTALQLPNLTIAPPQSIRHVAAYCQQALLVVSPDTGTMHLAAAVGTPVIALLNRDRSLRFAPNGLHDCAWVKPDPRQAAADTLRQYHSLQHALAVSIRTASHDDDSPVWHERDPVSIAS